jgi:DNA-binding MarR family transcriptional regulator
MNKELMQTVSNSALKLRLQVMTQILKPMKEMEREVSEFPPGFMHVLGWLKSKDGPVSMSDLACASFVSKPNLTTMVDRLCVEGLVERSADVNDRRIVNVALTAKGNDFIQKHKEEAMKFIESRLALLEDEDLKRLKHALDDITEIMTIIGEKQKKIK